MSREENKTKMMARLEEAIDELLDWEERNERPNLTQIEDIVLKLRKDIGEGMTEEMLAEMGRKTPVPRPACPECGKEMRLKGEFRKQIEGRMGEVDYERSYYNCPACEEGIFSLDEQMELKDAHWSAGLARQAVWLSGLVPFEQAAEILQVVGQADISGSSVWRLSQKWGGKLEELEEKEQEQANATPDGKEILAGEVRNERRMGLSMDGVMIYIRGEEWKELKMGCLFDIVPRPELDPKTGEWIEQGHAIHNRYTCHLGGPEIFGKKVWTEAQKRHFRRAMETEVVADGAVWIWNLVGDYFYDSHQLVDWYHGTEHLARAAHLLCGEGTPAAKRWLKEQETVLFQGCAEEIAAELTQWAEQKTAIREELLSEAGYFDKNKHRMSYMEMREEGWVIGSGMVESGGKQFKARFAGPGMRWSREGAEHLLPVRTAILSKRFNQRWKALYNSP